MSAEPNMIAVYAIAGVFVTGAVLVELVTSRLPHTHWLSKFLHPKDNRRDGDIGGWDSDPGCGGDGGGD